MNYKLPIYRLPELIIQSTAYLKVVNLCCLLVIVVSVLRITHQIGQGLLTKQMLLYLYSCS